MLIVGDASAGQSGEATNGEIAVIHPIANDRVVVIDAERRESAVIAVHIEPRVESVELTRSLGLRVGKTCVEREDQDTDQCKARAPDNIQPI